MRGGGLKLKVTKKGKDAKKELPEPLAAIIMSTENQNLLLDLLRTLHHKETALPKSRFEAHSKDMTIVRHSKPAAPAPSNPRVATLQGLGFPLALCERISGDPHCKGYSDDDMVLAMLQHMVDAQGAQHMSPSDDE
eukprot:gene977-2597_t